MKRIVICLIALSFSSALAQTGKNRMLSNLVDEISSGRVKKVHVIRMPDNVSTVVALNPQGLRTNAYYSMDLSQGFSVGLRKVFEGCQAKAEGGETDVRWGILFLDGSGHEMGSVFFNKFGDRGYLNNEPVIFSLNIAKRMKQFIGQAW